MISISETEWLANKLMQERHGEPIRSRQVRVVIAAIVAKVNEELENIRNKEANKVLAPVKIITKKARKKRGN